MIKPFEKEIKRLYQELEALEKSENSYLELKKEFTKLIDETLDCYNDKLISKDLMEKFIKHGNEKLKDIGSGLKSIEEWKGIVNKLIEMMKERQEDELY